MTTVAAIVLGPVLAGLIWAAFDRYVPAVVIRPRTSPREIFIDRLRATGSIPASDYAHVLELTPVHPGETGADLAQGYRDYLAALTRRAEGQRSVFARG